MLLRQQVRVLQHKGRPPKRFSRFEKTLFLLAVLVAKMKEIADDYHSQLEPVLLFKPDTVLRWHCELVRRKWTFKRRPPLGRSNISPELAALVLQLARENPRWGYGRMEGELLKLGYAMSRSSVRNLLKQHGIPPVSKRQPKST